MQPSDQQPQPRGEEPRAQRKVLKDLRRESIASSAKLVFALRPRPSHLTCDGTPRSRATTARAPRVAGGSQGGSPLARDDAAARASRVARRATSPLAVAASTPLESPRLRAHAQLEPRHGPRARRRLGLSLDERGCLRAARLPTEEASRPRRAPQPSGAHTCRVDEMLSSSRHKRRRVTRRQHRRACAAHPHRPRLQNSPQTRNPRRRSGYQA